LSPIALPQRLRQPRGTLILAAMEGLRRRWLLIALTTASSLAAQEPSRPAKDEPKPVVKVKLNLRCSDTLLELEQQLGIEFGKANPNLEVVVNGGGSGAAIGGLMNGATDLALTTRPATDQELAAIRSKGFEPMEQVLGHEDLAVIVHKDNPIESLTVEQLVEVWSDQGATTRWSQLGVPAVEPDEVLLVNRQNNSGDYTWFREVVLGRQRRYRAGSVAVNGSKDVVDRVAVTPSAIGYCRAAYVVGDKVKAVPMLTKVGGKNEPVSANSPGYPLRRAIYVYFRDEATGNAKTFATWSKTSEAVKAAGLTIGAPAEAAGRKEGR
jgi:phosphate transport system substrate-binding protein